MERVPLKQRLNAMQAERSRFRLRPQKISLTGESMTPLGTHFLDCTRSVSLGRFSRNRPRILLSSPSENCLYVSSFTISDALILIAPSLILLVCFQVRWRSSPSAKVPCS